MLISVIGGGLAGSEAAWQAAQMGAEVNLYEMRPSVKSGVHHTDLLGELVCTDYLGPDDMGNNHGDITRGQALLREELRIMDSLIMKCADKGRIKSKKYFAIDKIKLSGEVTDCISNHKRINVIREEITSIPEGPVIIATGPLTSPAIAENIANYIGKENYFGFEASAPLVHGRSVNLEKTFKVCNEDGEYIFCPLTEEEFNILYTGLSSGEKVKPHMVEQIYITDVKIPDMPYFDRFGGQAVEDHNRDGLLNMVMNFSIDGLNKPFAMVRLEKDRSDKDLYKITGFQTRLKHGEQKRIFRMIPALEKAEIIRFGHIHLSCYINSGQLLPTLQHKKREDLFFAGEIAGTDTYLAAIGTGWIAGQNGARVLKGEVPLILPESTMFGSLCRYLAYASPSTFQPMVPNIFLLKPCPSIEDLGDMGKIKNFYDKSLKDLKEYLA